MIKSLSFGKTKEKNLGKIIQRTILNSIKKFSIMDNSLTEKNLGIFTFSLLTFFIVLLFTYPKYLEFLLDGNIIATHSYFFDKINSPFQPVHALQEKHGAKIDFRLTVPLLAKMLGIPINGSGKSVTIIYVIQSILLIPFLFFLIKLLRRYISNSGTILLIVAFSSVYLSKSFFWDYDFWFDGYAYFFLLLAMVSKTRLGILVSMQIACWTDERAVIASSSVFLFHLLNENNFHLHRLNQLFDRKFLLKNSTVILFSGTLYVLLRVFLSHHFDLQTPIGKGSGAEIEMVPYQLKYRLSGIFLSFEGLWLSFILSMFLLIQKRNVLTAGLVLGLMAIHIIVAYSVFDISRSMTYAFPLIIISVIILAKHNLENQKYLHGIMALICALIPTQFLIFFPRQIPWTILSYSELKPIISVVFSWFHIYIR